MGSNEANNWPQTVEKDVEFALKLHNAKNRGKGRGESPKLLPQRLYFSNLLMRQSRQSRRPPSAKAAPEADHQARSAQHAVAMRTLERQVHALMQA
jgi:hypothetical protein